MFNGFLCRFIFEDIANQIAAEFQLINGQTLNVLVLSLVHLTSLDLAEDQVEDDLRAPSERSEGHSWNVGFIE